MKNIVFVAGARPNFMKISPVVHELEKRGGFSIMLVHTGQHYDKNMSDLFFDDLNLKKPDINLGATNESGIKQIADIMFKLEPILLDKKPDIVVVVGDVNSTLAGALTASKLNIPIAHVEAGYRSFDWTMPEEINRMVVDKISQLLFAPTDYAVRNLLKEGIPKERIKLVGNVMIDSLVQNMNKIDSRGAILQKLGLKEREYAVMTVHRPSNVDSKEVLNRLIDVMSFVQEKIKLVYPIHPRTKRRLEEFDSNSRLDSMKNLITTEPLSYTYFMNLVKNSRFVMTDSGGIQEETTFLKIPCVTLRENTERLITLEGTNVLTGLDIKRVEQIVERLISDKAYYKTFSKKPNIKLWDGEASKRIVDIIMNANLKIPSCNMLS